MALSAKKEYDLALKCLKRNIEASGRSLREIAQMTIGLEPPESLHHSHLSLALRGEQNRMITFRHVLVMAKLLNFPLWSLQADVDPGKAKRVDRILKKMAAANDDQLSKIEAILEK